MWTRLGVLYATPFPPRIVMRHRKTLSRLRICALMFFPVILGSMAWSAFAATDRCALLKDGEIDEAIGSHERGNNGLPNEWGNNSCRWTAKNAPAAKARDGWRDAIELGVFEGAMISWAQGQARGEPIGGVVKDAKWDSSYGELWFNCAGGRVCVVKVRTAESKQRQAIATKLASLVEGRLR
jgi:hypothetical protein